MRQNSPKDLRILREIFTPHFYPRLAGLFWCLLFLLAAGLAAGITGCATLNPTVPCGGYPGDSVGSAAPLPPTSTASAPAGQALPTAQATMPGEAGATGLAECIEIALRNNPDIAAGASDIDAKRAERDIAAAERWPGIHATGGYAHNLDAQRLIAPRRNNELGYFTDDLFSADLVLTMPLYRGGRITNSIKAADLMRQVAEHTLARTREELVYNVSSVFYSILAQRRLIDSLAFSENALKEHLKRVNHLIDAGKAPKVDGMRTNVRLAEVTQRHLQEQNLLEIQQRVLSTLLGLEKEPAGGLHIDGTLDPAPLDLDLNGGLETAFSVRPDYAAARAALKAQARRVDVARGEREPSVMLEASYGERWGVGGSGDSYSPASETLTLGAGALPSYTRTPATRGNVVVAGTVNPASTRITSIDQPAAGPNGDVGHIGVKIDVPVFEGGRISARIRDERAKLRAAEQRLRRLELQIRLDVETAVLNAGSARERIQVTEKAIEEGKESLRIMREKYDSGRGVIVDVLDAQSALLEAQTTYYRALADYSVAVAQLRLATGEGSVETTKPKTENRS